MKEVFKDIKDYEGYYQVSNLGRVRSLDRVVVSYYRTRKIKGQILRICYNKNGYGSVGLNKNHTIKRLRVNRLVWEAFNGSIPEGYQVNHIDEDKANNRLDNLNLLTPKENSNWGTRTQRCIDNRKGKTARRPIIQSNKNGNLIKEWASLRAIEIETGLSHQNIQKCCCGKTKSAYGYVWTYAA